jgi:hypothetical protein
LKNRKGRTVTAVDHYRAVVDVNLFYFIPHQTTADQQKCVAGNITNETADTNIIICLLPGVFVRQIYMVLVLE